jgi:hypothetical protein
MDIPSNEFSAEFQPSGYLQYNYHQPLSNLSVDLRHTLEAEELSSGWREIMPDAPTIIPCK